MRASRHRSDLPLRGYASACEPSREGVDRATIFVTATPSSSGPIAADLGERARAHTCGLGGHGGPTSSRPCTVGELRADLQHIVSGWRRSRERIRRCGRSCRYIPTPMSATGYTVLAGLPNVRLVDPLPYFDMVYLLAHQHNILRIPAVFRKRGRRSKAPYCGSPRHGAARGGGCGFGAVGRCR